MEHMRVDGEYWKIERTRLWKSTIDFCPECLKQQEDSLVAISSHVKLFVLDEHGYPTVDNSLKQQAGEPFILKQKKLCKQKTSAEKKRNAWA